MTICPVSQSFLGLWHSQQLVGARVGCCHEVTSVDPDRRDLADRVLADNADMRSVHSAASVQRMIERVTPPGRARGLKVRLSGCGPV